MDVVDRSTVSSAAAPDVYFEPGYGIADAGDAGEWVRLDDHAGAWQLPVKIGANRVGHVTSPYGYAGVFADPELSDRDARRSWEVALDHLRERGCVTLFLRCSALVSHMSLPEDVRWIVRDHQTFLLGLRDEEAMWSGMEGRCRTSIRKAEREGIRVAIEPARDADLASGSCFRSLYESTMDLRGAGSSYYFDDDYYSRLRASLGERLLLGTATDERGEVLAASLFMVGPTNLHYHLSGGTREAGRRGATNMLIWESARHGRALGLSGLHLGGGVLNGDGLAKFKRSFGGTALTYRAAGVVIDRDRYLDFVHETANRTGRQPSDLEPTQDFPPYEVSV